jgi:methanogenic corrinoid protein MtbC1
MKNEKSSNSIQHSIGVVSRRTGLKPDLIRAWENRFGAVEPGRTATNRRFYTDEQVEKLFLLRQATLSGRSISQVAGLSIADLRSLVEEDRIAIGRASGSGGNTPVKVGNGFLDDCLKAVADLDTRALRYYLEKAAAELTEPHLIEELVIPLVEKIGDGWEKGEMRIVHEHAASSVIRAFLENMHIGALHEGKAPSIVVGTPVGQNHEIGALIASNTATAEGWDVLYLGAGLPAEEFAAAAAFKSASAVALSIVYPGDDPYLPAELRKLRRLLGDGVEIIAGGKSVPRYSGTLEEVSARIASDAGAFREILRQLRG